MFHMLLPSKARQSAVIVRWRRTIRTEQGEQGNMLMAVCMHNKDMKSRIKE